MNTSNTITTLNQENTANQIKSGLTLEGKEKRLRHFGFFSIGSLLYALFYTFCLYKNSSGITYPFFIGGTLFYFFLSLKKLGISAKKDSLFYMVALMLLGISTFLTDDGNIHFMNKMGIFVLTFSMMIHNFFRDDDWNLSKYLSAIAQTVFGSFSVLNRPFSDFNLYLKEKRKSNTQDDEDNSKGKYILYGLLISVPVLIVIIFLLGSADMVFAALIEKMFESISLPQNLISICFSIIFAFLASYCVITYLVNHSIKEQVDDKRVGEPILAITISSLLSIIYVIFSGIQILYLFMGNMQLPQQYTYAEYARQGFFQLLFVCILNLAFVLIGLNYFKENRILKGILTVISLCTYVMIASSAMRMLMYIKYYYLTFLRIFVLWSLFVIFLLMTGVLISIYKNSFPLFRYCMIVVTVLYIALSFSRPDYFIAKCNTDYMLTGKKSSFFDTGTRYSDTDYLKNLSADAAPVLLSPGKLESYSNLKEAGVEPYDYLGNTWDYLYVNKMVKKTENMTARSFNVSRYYAGYLMEKYTPVSSSH